MENIDVQDFNFQLIKVRNIKLPRTILAFQIYSAWNATKETSQATDTDRNFKLATERGILVQLSKRLYIG